MTTHALTAEESAMIRDAELEAIRSEGPVFNKEGADELVASDRREAYLSAVVPA